MTGPCAACRHARRAGYLWRERDCHHPEIGPKHAPYQNPVTGKTLPATWHDCETNRAPGGSCGVEGKYWEAK